MLAFLLHFYVIIPVISVTKLTTDMACFPVWHPEFFLS